MNLTIEDKNKLETFVSIFQLLKCWSSSVSIHFLHDKMTIQIMDKSQICFTFIQFDKSWFNAYLSNEEKTTIQSTQLAILMNHSLKHDILEIILEDGLDKIQFNCFEKEKYYENTIDSEEGQKSNTKDKKSKSKDLKHGKKDATQKKNNQYISHFELLLLDVEEDEFTIPNIEYDVEFTLDSKKFIDILHEIEAFGDTIHISASEDNLYFQTTGDFGTIKIDYPIDNLEEYSISEGLTLSIHFSLSHLIRLCTSNKLNDCVTISLHETYPMSIKYTIDNDKSYASFYIASKIVDDI